MRLHDAAGDEEPQPGSALFSFVVKKGSKMRARFSANSGTPLSAIDTRTRSRMRAAVMVISCSAPIATVDATARH